MNNNYFNLISQKNKLTINKRTLWYCGIFLLLNILCFFQYEKFPIGALIITGLLLLLGCFIRYEELGIYIFICLAFFNVMNAKVLTTSLYYILCGVVIIRYLFQEKNKYKFPQKVILLCLIFFLTAFNMTVGKRYWSWYILLSTCIILYHEHIINNKIADIIEYYSIALIFASWWGYLMVHNGMPISNGSDMYLAGNYSYLRFAGLVGDSVWFGGVLLIAIAENLVLFLGNSQKKWLQIFLISNMILLGALSYSKTFFGGVIIELLIFWWYWITNEKKKIRPLLHKLFVIITSIVVFIIWANSGTDKIITTIRERMSASDLTTGRLTVWKYYIDLCLNDWTILFKGIGLSRYAERRTFAGLSHSIRYAHNILIETVVAFGLLETILILFGMGIALHNFLKRNCRLFWIFPAFILFVVFGMVSHGHFDTFYYFNVLLVITTASKDAEILISKPANIKNNPNKIQKQYT